VLLWRSERFNALQQFAKLNIKIDTMKNTGITSNEILISIENNNFKIENLVSILELAVSKLNINTISGMAKSEGKTPRGIRVSNCYRKTLIGKQKFAIKGLDDVNFPF